MTWQLTNHGQNPAVITGNTRGATFAPTEVAAGGTSVASQVLAGPIQDQDLANTVTVMVGGVAASATASVTAATCLGPVAPPDVSFTFTARPNVSSADVGDRVEVTYCGRNTSRIDLEVVRLVDDRLGLVLELPDVVTVVAPGEMLCNTDLGMQAAFVVSPADAGTVLHTNAVVTVQTLESAPRVFQATASSDVAITPVAAPTSSTTAPAGPAATVLAGRSFDWNWTYPPPTCTELTVTYPDDIPPGQANDVNVRIVNLDTGQSITLNFHNNQGTWSGTHSFVFRDHANWPNWPNYAVVWVQVAGTNYHWTGEVICREGTPPTTTTPATTTSSTSSTAPATSTTVPSSSTTMPPVLNPDTLETSHTVACGRIDVTLRNVSSGIFGMTVEVDGTELPGPVVDNRTDTDSDGTPDLDGPQQDRSVTAPFLFDEDGGVRSVRYRVATGSDRGLFDGLPVGTFQETPISVETDCESGEPPSSTESPASTAPASTEGVASTAPASTESPASTAPASTEGVASTAPASTEPSESTAPASTEGVASTAPASTEPSESAAPASTESPASTAPGSTEATSTSEATTTSTTTPVATTTTSTSTTTTTIAIETTTTNLLASTTTAVPSTSTGPTTTSSVAVAPTTTLIPPPPGITFTFTNDPSTPEASVGETVDYSYCGTNTSDVDLEVLRVDDSRFGTLEVPAAATIVRPGETLCNTDLGLPVSYTVAPADSGTTIVNDAVVTVRTVGVDAQSFEAADVAEVVVPAAVAPSTTIAAVTPTTTGETQIPSTGPNGLPSQVLAGLAALLGGSLLVFAARRRTSR